MNSKSPAQGLQTVSRAIAMIRTFRGGRREMSLKQLTDEMGLNKVTTFRLAQTLLAEGVLTQNDSGRYSVATAALALVDGLIGGDSLSAVAMPHLEAARDRCGETAAVLVREGWWRVVLATVSSQQPVRYVLEVGSRHVLHQGAAGQCLLLGLSPSELEDLWVFMAKDPLSQSFGLTQEEVLARMDHVRSHGWGTAKAEWNADSASVGAPIRDAAGNVVAALTLALPITRYNEEHRRFCAEIAVDTAAAIGAALDTARAA